jgi:hypothetical protein
MDGGGGVTAVARTLSFNRNTRTGSPIMTQQTRFNIGYAIAAFFLVLLIQYFVSVASQIATIPYSDFQRLLHDGKIASVGVSDRFIQGSLKEPLPSGQKQFVTTRVDPEFAGELDKYASATPARSRAHSCATCCRGSCPFSCSWGCGGISAGGSRNRRALAAG